MLDISNVEKVYLICGYTDLRFGVEKLAAIVKYKYNVQPESNAIFFFRGRRADRYRAIYWDDDGFILIKKSLKRGHFRWPSPLDRMIELTETEYHVLLESVSYSGKNAINGSLKLK